MKIAGLLIAFFVLVFTVAFLNNHHYANLVVVGESSVGTWMSGVLLIVCATVSLIIGVRNNLFVWFGVATFFFILALDERFMFHEHLKENLIFSFNITTYWIYELPVLAGTCVGFLVALLLWYNLQGVNRILLIFAVLLGFISVIFDILTKSVLIEECCKLLAELLLTCSLLRKIEAELNK